MTIDSDSNTTATPPLLVLDKICDILDAFTLKRRSLTLGEIHRTTGIPRSTVQRLVSNMIHQGFLDRCDDHFRVGTKMTSWAGLATSGLDILAVINSVLEEVRDCTGETTFYSRLEQNLCVAVAVAETNHELRHEMHVGKVAPLDEGSVGRILLAYSSDSTLRITDAQQQTKTGQQFHTQKTRFHNKNKIRADGYAITIGAHTSDAASLSAPVFDSAADVVGALTISGPTFRMPQAQCEAWVGLLVSQADRLIRTVGGRYPADTPE